MILTSIMKMVVTGAIRNRKKFREITRKTIRARLKSKPSLPALQNNKLHRCPVRKNMLI